ncbi:vancomycin high temperature exclusion protein [Bernardetia sp. OM2101]|uniref:SanA/YdcF family protein n=1 Tax=Bernardetia sp. OM2101 TaxID=3344876 RepID=UPI0035CEBDF9
MKYLKKLMILLLVLISGAIGSMIIADYLIVSKAESSLFKDVNTIPKKKVGLLLGTRKILSNGYINLYFKYRIAAAVSLYNAGKIEYFIVSGDNSKENYNEPEDMKNALMAKGIPENRIFMDFAGFRTLDSVVRAKEVFGQNSFTIISQKFHNERAIYLAHLEGMEVIAFNAKDVTISYGIKTQIREKLARVKVFIDYLTGKEPKFLGKKIIIP